MHTPAARSSFRMRRLHVRITINFRKRQSEHTYSGCKYLYKNNENMYNRPNFLLQNKLKCIIHKEVRKPMKIQNKSILYI